eukprot:4908539-Amphidinium_carterae.1
MKKNSAFPENVFAPAGRGTVVDVLKFFEYLNLEKVIPPVRQAPATACCNTESSRGVVASDMEFILEFAAV